MKNDSERINHLLEILNLSPSELSVELELKRAQGIYDIQKGKTGISKRMAELICTRFPSVSRQWLLTAEGAPLLGAASKGEETSTVQAQRIRLELQEEKIRQLEMRERELIRENAVLLYRLENKT